MPIHSWLIVVNRTLKHAITSTETRRVSVAAYRKNLNLKRGHDKCCVICDSVQKDKCNQYHPLSFADSDWDWDIFNA